MEGMTDGSPGMRSDETAHRIVVIEQSKVIAAMLE